jgi:tRNA-dihydrouridine synthase A
MNRRLSIAPMMDWTDRHCRAFHRALTAEALLYTEMVTAPAVVNGDRQRLLGFDALEHPVALQIGGSDPDQLAEAARIGEAFGYDEINLNVGCPSDRVQSGRFGACLMREPELVADCMAAIKEAVSVPATVKCRIGVDDQDPQVSLFATVDACAAVGIEAERPVAQGEPRRAAARLRPGAASEARASASVDLDQWRHHLAG